MVVSLSSAAVSCSQVGSQELGGVLLAQRVGHGDKAGVGGDLVVLGARAGTRQEHVQDVRRGTLVLDELVMLGLQALDTGTLLSFRLLTDSLERGLDVGDVLLGLGEVILERSREALVGRFLGQLRQCLHERPLSVEDVSKLMHEQFTWLFHVVPSFRLGREPIPTSHIGTASNGA